MSSTPAPFCSEIRRTPGIALRAANSRSGIERSLSKWEAPAFCQAIPILKPWVLRRSLQAATRSGSAVKNGPFRGTVSGAVPRMPGTLIIEAQRMSLDPARTATSDTAFHAGHRPQQRLQTRLGPQRDPISELGEMGAEAGEQDMVPKSLFASQDEQFVFQDFAAPGRPCGGRKALGDADLERDAPLVSWPGLAPTAVEQFDQGDRIEGLIVIGRDLQAVADVSQGFRKAAEHIECLGAVRVKQPAHGVVAIERDRAIEASHRLLEAGLLPEHHAAAELRFRHVRPDRQRALIARECFLAPAQPRERVAAVEMDFGEIRLARKRAVETVDGGFVAAQRGQRISAVRMRRGEIRS